MEISKLSTTEILAELKRRTDLENESESKPTLVFGTICIDGGKHFVEAFKEIKTDKDLSFIRNLELRSRFNSHRNYRGFYFKTDNYKGLEESMKKDNCAFAEFIRSSKSINFIKL
ncbi:MAG: hypothetical protein WC026_13230 [Hyphomicrobium sp.]|uniref:hypothetical protein n=1 Tax=Hyphomicrobium sp. TaxID=82 RepID=UPI00356176FB